MRRQEDDLGPDTTAIACSWDAMKSVSVRIIHHVPQQVCLLKFGHAPLRDKLTREGAKGRI